MKKTVIFMIIAALVISTTSAFAQTDFLSESYNNYSANYSISMSFESGEQIKALLDELGALEEIEKYADINMLLTSLLSTDSTKTIQADISEDYKKISLGVTTESENLISLNPNLSADIKQKYGSWLKLDISDEENPYFRIITSSPILNKYSYVDFFDVLPKENHKVIIETLNTVLNKDFIEKINNSCADIIKEYADIKVLPGKCTVKIDNVALLSIISKYGSIVTDILSEFDDIFTAEEIMSISSVFEKIANSSVTILGEEGIVITYGFSGDKVTNTDLDVDISFDVSELYTELTGEIWEYESTCNLDLKYHQTAEFFNIGTTKVSFPDLTEENSFYDEGSFGFLTYSAQTPAEEEFMTPYPAWYVSGECEYLPIIDDEIFVPLRMTLENAYSDQITITYDKGTVTATSEYFPGFKTLSLKSGSDKIYIDGKEHKTKKVIIKNDTMYVSSNLFVEHFGWEFSEAQYDLISKIYYFGFWTVV